MKKLTNIIFIALLLSSNLAIANAGTTITIRADEWYPFNGTPGSDKEGYMIDIARYAFEKNGYQLDYQVMPWERSIEEAGSGKIDCVVGAITEEVPEFVFHKTPLGVSTAGFYSLIDYPDFEFTGSDSLEGKSLAVIGGYGYGEKIDAYVQKYRNTSFVHVAKGDDALDRNIKMLLSGRVDLLVETQPVFEYKLSQIEGAEFIKEAAADTEAEPLYIACSPKNPKSKDYVRFIDEAIDELRRNGDMEKILGPYGVKDWGVNDAGESNQQ